MAAAAEERIARFHGARSQSGPDPGPLNRRKMRMIRRISSVAVALSVSLSAAVAGAQAAPGGFGSAGQFTIGAERMFGFVASSQTTTVETPVGEVDTTVSRSQFALLGLNGNREISPYGHPRIGFDYFVIDRLSVGGNLIFRTSSGETETEGGGASETDDDASTTTFVFGPRAGYAFMFNDTIGIWPRAGFTFYTNSTTQESPTGDFEDDENGLALTLEGLFVIAPLPHVGFTVGPTFDIGLTGSYEETDPPPNPVSVESDRRVTDLALHAGVVVWF
jgi:hypothetical protein